MDFSPFRQSFSTHSNVLAWNNLSYGDIWERVQALKKELLEKGIQSSHRVAIAFEDKEETLLHLYALWDLGASVVCLSYKFPSEHIFRLRKQANFHFLLNSYGSEEYNEEVKKQVNEALIVFTSGSSGEPKGVLLSFENIYYSALGTNEFYQLHHNDCWWASLPLFHVGGLMIGIRCLLAGASLTFQKEKANFLSLVPTQLQALLNDETHLTWLQQSKAILVGGGPSSQSLKELASKHKLPISHTYGQTESCSQLTATEPSNPYFSDSVGSSLPFRDFKVNSSKRICISGKTRFLGYLQNNQFVQPFSKEGYFESQDLGELSKNILYLKGRADQVFISGGENISSSEIINAMLLIPEVTEAYIIPVPHHKFGLIPMAFYKSNHPYKNETLKEALKQQLPSYKVPKYFHPLSHTKENLKITKEQLEEMAKRILEESE